MNSCVATATDGTPSFSNRNVSCKLHVVQDPQSAKASITASARRTVSMRSAGAGFAKVGFIARITLITPWRSLSSRSRRSRKTLPPGLLMSSSAIVRPCNRLRRGAAATGSGATSFIGFTKVIDIVFSLNRIGDHLAAPRAGGPASEHGGKLSRRSTRDHDLNGFGGAELLIARLTVYGDLFVDRALGDAIARLITVAAQRHAGVFEKKVANILLTEAVAMNRVNVFWPEDDQRLISQARAICPDGCERIANRLQHTARSPGIVFADSVRRL